MALSKVNYDSLNVTAAASKALKWNSGADGFETGDVAGSMVLLETQTASSSGTIDFTSGIDSTYKEYIFKLIDIHPETDGEDLGFQANAAGGSGYNETMQSAVWGSYHNEGGSDAAISYATGQDQQNGTGYQNLSANGHTGSDNDQCISGNLYLFGPSGTTYVTHFFSQTHSSTGDDYCLQSFTAGYFNLTGAVDEISFKFSSGNIDDGKIKLFGIKDS